MTKERPLRLRGPGQGLSLTPIALVALLAVCVTSPAVAQSPSGSIAGTVVDATAQPLPGVSVTVRNLGTSSIRTAVTAINGSFTFPLLPVGSYEATAELTGFKPVKASNIKVEIGSDISLKLTMDLATVAAQVEVSVEAPLVETTRSQVSSVVNEKYIANLPTNGRNFIDFVLTTPGVSRDVRGGDISFAGQRGTLNSLVVDGADNNNTFFGQTSGRTGSGRAPYQFSQDAVREFQVNSNAYSAEYGRAGGAVVNVVTKSGTNEFHGSAFFFKRDKSLNANDYINVINGADKGPYKFDQFGASLGGPLVRDKVFFFANYDGQRNTVPNLVVLGVPAGGYPTDAASQAALQRLQALGNSWERRQDQDTILFKGDVELSQAHRLSLRYNRQNFTGQNFENGGLTNAEEHTGNSLVKTDTITASLSSNLSSSFVNEVRGQYARDKEPGEANSANPEATVRQGGTTVLVIGRNSFSPRETTINRYQVADTALFLLPKHTLKLGFDFNRDLILNNFPGNFSGVYSFNSLAGFNSGRPDTYTQAFPGSGTSGPVTNPDLSEIAFFAQDEFRPTSNLTINLGYRYDRQGIHQPNIQNPDAQLLAAGIDTSSIPEDGNNHALRLGFAFTPPKSDKTVIRAGYGMFYGRTPSIMIGTAHSNNGINVQTLTFTGAAVPTYPGVFATPPAGGTAPKPTIFYFDRNFQNPLVHQASFGIEHGVTPEISVSLNYLWVKGTNLPRSADINQGAFTPTTIQDDLGNTFTYRRYSNTRPFTNFARIIAFQSTADSNYNGLTLEVNKRYSSHWQARIAYTFSKVLDNKPDATAVVPNSTGDDAKYAQDPFFVADDYGLGENDIRHRFVISGVWNLDYFKGDDFVSKYILGGWSLSAIASYSKGQPYSAGIGPATDLNNDQNRNNDRSPGFGRNTFNLPSLLSIDPRITKEFGFGDIKLQIIAEAFNVLNRANVSGVRTQYYNIVNNRLVANFGGRTAFGTPTTSSGPRIVQLAAKVIF